MLSEAKHLSLYRQAVAHLSGLLHCSGVGDLGAV